MSEEAPTYPRKHVINGVEITLRPMTAGDREGVLAFARALPQHDLMFLRRDITEEPAVNDWIREIEEGEIATILAVVGDEVVGYSSIQLSKLAWSAHVGELRVLIAESMRHKGLGKLLTTDAFRLALSLGVEKMMAQMTVDQKGAIAAFEGLGFRPEALLRDHVRDREGKKHDLLVLSHDVSRPGPEEE